MYDNNKMGIADPLQLSLKIQEYVDWNCENLYDTKDNEMLYNFVYNIFGFKIPRIKVCEDHCAPLDFVADSFYDRHSKVIAVANRNGGKTQNFGILNALDGACKKYCEVASVGAIEDQANKCYQYTISLLKKPHFKNKLEKEPMRSLTELTNGSKISVLPGTMAGVNGPHPQRTNFDEIELTQWKILMEFLSMAKSNPNAPACVRLTSSRKFSHGCMQRMLDEREERKFKLYVWCIWETIEPCTDRRSGTVPCYVVVPTADGTSIEQFKVFSNNKDDFNKAFPLDVLRKNREKYTGCLACPLVEVCRTKAKRSDGYYEIGDTIDKFTGLDRETWDCQWECKKPGRKGLVYTDFDETVNVIPRSSFTFNPKLPVAFATDFGFEDPSGTACMQFLPNGDAVIFDELYIRRTQTPVLIEKYWKPLYERYYSESFEWYGDSENPDAISQMNSAGLPVQPAIKRIIKGIEKVRSWIRNADGYSRLYVCDNCKNVLKEFNSYHYPENGGEIPVDKDNHLMDPIRYIFDTKFNDDYSVGGGSEVVVESM